MTTDAEAESSAERARTIAVLGAGSWGTALAALLAKNGHAVRLWARDPALARALREASENVRYLPGIPLPQAVTPTADLAAALTGAEVVVFAVPSGAMRQVAQEAALHLAPDALPVSAAKGLEERSGLRMSQVLAQAIPGTETRLVALSGPNLAVEVARGIPTASVAASTNPEAARAVQRLFTGQPSPTFRVYTGRDVVGVELGGAIKNVIAIGAGVCDGLGYGDNSKAALMTRGLTEILRLGVAQGAAAATFLGLSGVGDLIATGASRLSRNYRVGYALGQGRALPDILAELGQVAEGVPTTHVVCALAARSQVEMPLCGALYALLFEQRAAPDVIRELMLRPLKEEGF
ncbi:MAG TPA: NAD(P)H-dependent glycerol-3-phosphate dehydrogenase [Chthonomonadaceae bacterium]|nr:NAD(P)H-dependent glycerol-3-phosphate dehydrogenase [Chthonomonadaceae bacterium]